MTDLIKALAELSNFIARAMWAEPETKPAPRPNPYHGRKSFRTGR